MVQSDDNMERTSRGGERRKILVVSVRDRLSDELRDHSVHLAERLRCDLLILSVGPPWGQDVFARCAERATRELRRQAASIEVRCEHIVRFGDPGLALEEVKNQVKRIALVVADPEVDRSGILEDLTIPVFTVSPRTRELKGDRIMSASTARHRNLVARTAAYGLLSAGLYTAVFMNADTVMSHFTRGGLFAALPIATVLVFSFAHGAFASNLWSLLGIEAVRRDVLTQTEKKAVQARKPAHKRPRAYAYVNPFHRM